MLKCVPLKSAALLRSFSHFPSLKPHNPNYSKYAFYSSCTRQKLHNTCAHSFENTYNAVVTFHTRNYATESSTKWKGRRLKPYRKRKKKYAELLEVKEGMVTKQKIKVENLNNCNVEKMAQDTLSLRAFMVSRSLKEEVEIARIVAKLFMDPWLRSQKGPKNISQTSRRSALQCSTESCSL